MKVIGKPHKRIDGKYKVNGKALFGNDLKLNNMLYAACRYSDIPAGKIKSIDYTNALANEQVVKIGTYKDVTGAKRVGPIRQDYYPIVNDEVFFVGDVIAVVVSESKHEAHKAVSQIKVEYEVFEPVSDIEKAALPESRLVHPDYESNIVVDYPLKKGDINEGFQIADHIIEREYNTGFQEHAYLEPETVTVEPDHETGGLIIYGSIQNPFTTRKVVSDFLKLPLNRISVKPSVLGGSFGGKDDVINNMACRTALMAVLTNRPVQMTNSREISMRESYKRHPYHLKYKAGYKKTGELTALEIDILADSGAYSSQTFFVTWRSLVQAAGPYLVPNVKTRVRAVYTNNCYTAAFRGFGSPQVIFAIESLMDEIAENLGLSPQEIRLTNALKQNSITATGQKLTEHKVSLEEVINKAVKKSNYKKKHKEFSEYNKSSHRYKKGIGLACSFRGCSLGAEGTDASSAIVSVQADSSVIVLTGVTENGQGLGTAMSLIAAEELGITLNDIVFLSPNTSQIADGGPTVASRGTIAGGNAVRNAALNVKNTIFPLIKDKLAAKDLSETEWKEGMIYAKNNQISFKEAVSLCVAAGVNISAYGWFKAPPVSWDEEEGQGDAYFTYVYGCQIAEITVDTLTGKINADNITAAHDVGRVINLPGALGQIYGGVIQGMGYALLEDYTMSNSEVITDNFDTYLIPTIKDTPPIDAMFIENPDKAGPMGAKSLGEPTLEIISASVNNALHHAIGKHNYSLPVSMEEVFLNKKLTKTKRQSQAGNQSSFKHPELKIEKTFIPSDLDEALKIIDNEKPKILAGGTDVLIDLRGSSKEAKLISIKQLSELSQIKIHEDYVEIGAAATFKQIISNEFLSNSFPLIKMACSLIGSTQIRNQATIAGNLVNAAPCADSAPPLLIDDAEVILQSYESKRVVKLSEFILSSYKTVIKPNELVISIKIPVSKFQDKLYYHYFQLGRRNALNITRTSICGKVSFDENSKIKLVKLAAGSLLNYPARLIDAENYLHGKLLDEDSINVAAEMIEDMLIEKIGKRWSAAYKIPVFVNLFKAALSDFENQRKG